MATAAINSALGVQWQAQFPPRTLDLASASCVILCAVSVYLFVHITLWPTGFLRRQRMLLRPSPLVRPSKAGAAQDEWDRVEDAHTAVGQAYAFHGIWHALLALLCWQHRNDSVEDMRNFCWVVFAMILMFVGNYWRMASSHLEGHGQAGAVGEPPVTRTRVWQTGTWRAAFILAGNTMWWMLLGAFLHRKDAGAE